MTSLFEYADCMETFESVRDALEDVERRLAKELNLPVRGIRRHLHVKSSDGSLLETPNVAEWHRRYAAYADWVDEAAAGTDPDGLLATDRTPEPDPPRFPGPPRETREAAHAASSLS